MFKRTLFFLLFVAFVGIALVKVLGMPDWMQQRWDGLWAGSGSDSTAVALDSTAQAMKNVSAKTGKKSSSSTGKYAKIDAHALATPPGKEKDIPTLAAYLVAPAQNELQKARAIFRWMTDRIAYDDVGYNTDKIGKESAEAVLAERVGVCDDYATLFKALAEAAGLEAEYIGGLAKGYGYVEGGSMQEPGHAWNAFKANGNWHLVDVTWGAGHGTTIDGKLKSTKKFKPSWFDVDPHAFVLAHLPDDSQWQLLAQPLTQSQLEKMPEVELELFDIGFDPKLVLEGLRAVPMTAPPVTWNHDLPIRDFQGPYSRFVKVGEQIEFGFRCVKCKSAAIIQDKEWFYFEADKGWWSLRFTPQPGAFKLAAKKDGKSYFGFLEYFAKRVVGLAG
jgi:Transglutaminase-like superfamily